MPYQLMGYPFAMNVQTGLTYAPLWVFPALGLEYTLRAANIFQALHILAGSVGMFLLVRARFGRIWPAGVAGVAFQLFGGFFSNGEHVDIVRAFSLVPWALWSLLLSDEPPRTVRLWHWDFSTRLRLRNLLLPLVLGLFVTGSYVGNMIAGLLLFAVFALVQGGLLALARPIWPALRDTLCLALLATVGVALAAPYLVPALTFLPQNVRVDYNGQIERWYLGRWATMHLLFPSSVGYDHFPGGHLNCRSMYGMQLPIVLFPLLFLVRRRDLPRLLPFLAMTALAVIMCFEPCVPLSREVLRLLPPLGMSRFPVGDYRLFLYLGLLLPCVAGLRRLLEQPGRLPLRMFGRLVLGTCVLLFLAAHLIDHCIPESNRLAFLRVFAVQVACLAAFLLIVWLARPGLRRRLAIGLSLPALCLACMWPIAMDLEGYWKQPDELVEQFHYGLHGVTLKEGGRLSVEQLFRRPVPTPRPARQNVEVFHHAACRGYVNGTFMLTDYGGHRGRCWNQATSNAELRRFMAEPSRLVGFAPPAAGATAAELPSIPEKGAGLLTDWRVVRYGRNQLVYEVALDRSALVVENELYDAGWQGQLADGSQLRPIPVGGALRGWLLPAGRHRLELSYYTPGLNAGFAVGGATLLGYLLFLGSLLLFRRRAADGGTPAASSVSG
jgi:hypothetical protein